MNLYQRLFLVCTGLVIAVLFLIPPWDAINHEDVSVNIVYIGHAPVWARFPLPAMALTHTFQIDKQRLMSEVCFCLSLGFTAFIYATACKKPPLVKLSDWERSRAPWNRSQGISHTSSSEPAFPRSV